MLAAKYRAHCHYHLNFLDVLVGDSIGLLQVHHGVQGQAHQQLPHGGEEVQTQRYVCPNGDAQQLKVESGNIQLIVCSLY